MAVPEIAAVDLGGGPEHPLLVCGPSLGTSATALWSACTAHLPDVHVLAWDLPGHGRSPAPVAGFDMAELAEGVLARVDRVLAERGEPGAAFAYAGDSVGGAVGLRLLLDRPARVRCAALLCTGARIGEPGSWHERAATVRSAGTASMVEGSRERWFSPGFAEEHPGVASTLLDSLRETGEEGYARVCEALAGFDVRDRLDQVTAPVLAVAGADDATTPTPGLREIADGVGGVGRGRLVVLDRVAHLAPAEAPAEVAALLGDQLGAPAPAPTMEDVRRAGMEVRRSVLGAEHVDRATASVTEFTADFQELITRYAWGSVWTRPGLDRRSRSMITLTALVAGGHHDELALHVRAARINGLSDAEIGEVLLHSAVYCGVPAANTAFRIAQDVLHRLDEDDG